MDSKRVERLSPPYYAASTVEFSSLLLPSLSFTPGLISLLRAEAELRVAGSPARFTPSPPTSLHPPPHTSFPIPTRSRLRQTPAATSTSQTEPSSIYSSSTSLHFISPCPRSSPLPKLELFFKGKDRRSQPLFARFSIHCVPLIPLLHSPSPNEPFLTETFR